MITIDASGNLDCAPVEREIGRLRTLARDLKRLLNGTPTLVDDAPVIDHWQLALRQEPCLAGTVAGRPLGVGGSDRITVTSGPLFLDAHGGYARTLSRWYRLGLKRPGDGSLMCSIRHTHTNLTPGAFRQASDPTRGGF